LVPGEVSDLRCGTLQPLSTLASFPQLVAQLDRRKNGAIAPDAISRSSHLRLWWRCPEGPDHLWEAPVHRRTTGHGCPFCANLRVSVTNSLSAVAPEIARQWHPTKNGELTPHDVVFGSARAVWWRCPDDPAHAWRVPVVARTRMGRSCPHCTGWHEGRVHGRVVSDRRLAAEWHPVRNGDLTPRDVTLGSGRLVWWKCRKGPDHEWESPVGDRLKNGCPFCANMRVSLTNSVAAVAPAIAAEWHPTKNGKLTPHDVIAGSPRRVWWKCPKGPDHEWSANVANRRSGNGCPFCANRRLCASNSLAATYPEIAREWHPGRNGKLTPRDIVAGTSRRIWWRCAFGHIWCTSISNRVRRGSNCPECWRLRRGQPIATKASRRRRVQLAAYEGAHHGPVRRVK
jgi:predicted secreted protein